ncbi:nuclear transport factor 2 family protein [Streptomyces sp. NPDC101118]|uniref:nuclear transport factor 2 family protein n=1 Tax=Streptomyces sp. NPDC101118 TaxID=3366109 RepID=UPI0038168219
MTSHAMKTETVSRPDLDESLVARMWEYLHAGLAMDVETLDALYDPEFTNIRADGAGRTVTLTKAQFMSRFRALRARGERVGESVDDIRFVATTVCDDQGTIVMRRAEDDAPALYLYVWRRRDGQWSTLVREFTFEHDLSALLAQIGKG